MLGKGRIKTILARIMGKDEILVSAPAETEPIIRQREPLEDELTLGYAYGIDDETDAPLYQLKGIEKKYRDSHFYILGTTGTGKSRFLQHLIRQDIKGGAGFCVIDPHGDLIEDIKGWLYLTRYGTGRDLKKDVVLVEPTNPDFTIAFNPLEQIGKFPAEEIAEELVGIFKKIWKDAWGDRMADILRNSLIALVESNLTLVELPLLLTDETIRKKILKKVKNPHCLRCFKAYERVRPNVWREWIESTLNKVNALLADKRMRHIFTPSKSSFDLRDIMANQKILLVKLEKGRMKGSADLLGSLLLTKIQMAAFGRTDLPPEERPPFYLYIDEFQNFATESFKEILSESRKYGLSLVLAHQSLAQLPSDLRALILGNCRVQVCFQVSRDDAQIMAKELLTPIYRQPPGWEVNVQSLQELENRECVIKNKKEGGIVKVYTADVQEPWKIAREAKGELGGTTPRAFKESVKEGQIGIEYMIKRSKAERAYKRRDKQLTSAEEPKSFREPKK